MHVMSIYVSERECDVYHSQSMGAGGRGLLLLSAFKAL